MIGQLLLPVLRSHSLKKLGGRSGGGSGGKSGGDAGLPLRAMLDDELCWHCADPQWASLLNARFPAPEVVTDRTVTGRFLLYRAGESLSARVQVGECEAAAV